MMKFEALSMLSLMDGLNYLLICGCFLSVCTDGRHKDVFTLCENLILVQRGTVIRAAPGQHVTIGCPIKHCRESLNVTWCKLLDTANCEQIHESDNIQIRQNHEQVKLMSDLTFKQISINDDGLYRCEVDKDLMGHAINVSVSDKHHLFDNAIPPYDDGTDQSQSSRWDKTWLPYLYICVSLVLVVLTLTVLTLFNGWKRILTIQHAKRKALSTQVIPDLPKRSAPPTPVLQTHFSVLNDIYSPRPLVTPNLPTTPHTPPSGNQAAVGNTAEKSSGSGCAVYAVINHRQSGIPARKQQSNATQDRNTQYAVINVP